MTGGSQLQLGKRLSCHTPYRDKRQTQTITQLLIGALAVKRDVLPPPQAPATNQVKDRPLVFKKLCQIYEQQQQQQQLLARVML